MKTTLLASVALAVSLAIPAHAAERIEMLDRQQYVRAVDEALDVARKIAVSDPCAMRVIPQRALEYPERLSAHEWDVLFEQVTQQCSSWHERP
jgi:hypothetical protein